MFAQTSCRKQTPKAGANTSVIWTAEKMGNSSGGIPLLVIFTAPQSKVSRMTFLRTAVQEALLHWRNLAPERNIERRRGGSQKIAPSGLPGPGDAISRQVGKVMSGCMSSLARIASCPSRLKAKRDDARASGEGLTGRSQPSRCPSSSGAPR